jgi:hypothetical protein
MTQQAMNGTAADQVGSMKVGLVIAGLLAVGWGSLNVDRSGGRFDAFMKSDQWRTPVLTRTLSINRCIAGA